MSGELSTPIEPWDERNFGGDKGIDWRYRWYHDDLSPETRRLLYSLPVAEYDAWANGLALVFALRRHESGFEDTFPLKLWQLESLAAMRAHDDAEPAQVDYAAIAETASNYSFKTTLQWLAHSLEPLSPESKAIFENMWLTKWHRWRPRYIAIVESAAACVVPQFHPGLRKCEREVFDALVRLHSQSSDAPSAEK